MAAKTTKTAGKKAVATRATAKKPSKTVVRKLSFDAAKLVKQLLDEVPDRAREVLTYRFGLGTSSERETLEAIGERWSITRERVRQIELRAMNRVRQKAEAGGASFPLDLIS